jgi:hypothetical protein
MAPESLLVFLNVCRKIQQPHRITVVAFTSGIQGIIFPQGTKVLLRTNSSKDNTRVELERVEMDSYGSWVF